MVIKKRETCLYCGEKMESGTAKKKFCSELHRVYWHRGLEKGNLEPSQLDGTEKKPKDKKKNKPENKEKPSEANQEATPPQFKNNLEKILWENRQKFKK